MTTTTTTTTAAPITAHLIELADKLRDAQRRWKLHVKIEGRSDEESSGIAGEIGDLSDSLLNAVQQAAGPAPSAVRLPDGRLIVAAADGFEDGDEPARISIIEPARTVALKASQTVALS